MDPIQRTFEPDPVIEVFKKDVDRTLLRENLRLTPEERLQKLQSFVDFAAVMQDAGRQARG
jgi:hypothetical protein